MSKAKASSRLFEEKGTLLFKHLPMPSYAWQIKDNNFILIDYNDAAYDITKGNIENYMGMKAKELYNDQPEILANLFKCAKEKCNFFKEMKYKSKSIDLQKYFLVNYVFIHPNTVIIHKNDISENKQAELRCELMENKFKESEKKYHSILENTNDLIYLLNIRLEIEYVNEKVLNRILGYNRNDAIGKNLINLIHPDDHNKVLQAIKKGIKEGKGTIEVRIRNKDGIYKFHEVKGKFFTDIDGIQKALFTSRDITEKRLAELKLKESEAKYRNLFETFPYIIVLVDSNGKILDFNRNTLNFVNLTREDLIGKDFRELKFIDDEHMQIFRKKYIELVSKGFTEPIELKVDSKLANFNWINLQTSLVKFEGNSLIEVIIQDITESKLAEEKLSESEEKYRLLSENASDIIGVLNNKFEIEYINENALFHIGGYKIEDVIGKSGLNFVHPDDMEQTIKSLNKGRIEGKDKIDIRFRHNDGNFKWFEATGKIFTDKNGETKGTIILRDINDRKLAEAKLRESEEKFRLIAENSNDLIRVRNDKFKIEYINENAHQNLLGYSKEYLLQKSNKSIRPPEEYKQMNKLLKDLVKNGEASQEGRLIHKNGNYKWFDIRAKVFQDHEDNWKGLIISRDITDKKEAELKLKESEEKYRLIAESANDIIYILNQNLRFEYVNESVFMKKLGYLRDEVVGKTPLEIIHPDDIKRVRKGLFKGFKVGQGTIEVRLRDKEGNYHWFEVRGKTFLDSDGITKALSIARDISERKAAEQLLKESEEKFRTLAEQSSLGIAILQDNLIKYVNRALLNMFGLSIDEMTNWQYEQFFNVIHPEDKDFVAKQAMKKQLGEAGVVNQYQFRGIKKNGELLWLELFSKTINYQENPADFITIFDITGKKLAEKALKSEKQFSEDIINTTSDTIFVFEPETGKAIRWNKAFTEVSGYTNEEISSMKAPDSYYSEGDLVRAAKATNRLSVGGGATVEMSLISKDGRLIPFEYSARTFSTSDGRDLIVSYGRDMTERKEAERQLRESEEKFRLAFENAADAIFWVNSNTGLIINCNKSAEVLLEKPKDEIIGIHQMMLHPPQEKENYLKMFKIFAERGYQASKDVEVITKTGKLIPIELTASKTVIGGEEIIQGIFHDITDRKEVEKIIADVAKFPSENPNPVLRVNKEKILYTNQAGQNLFNISQGNKIPDLLQELVNTAFLHTNPQVLEFNLNNRFYIFNITPILETEYANIYGRDITNRKEAEQKLKNSEEKYRLISENAYDLIGILNKKFEYEYINEESFISTLGYTRGDLIGEYAINYVHQEDRELAIKKLAEGYKKGFGYAEVRFKHKNNQWIWIEVRGKTFMDSDGNLKALLISRDITERKEAEENLRDSEEKYRNAYDQANFYKDLFAHDINNIMQVINSSAELINFYMKSPEKTDEISTITEMIKKQVSRAKLLVHNVNTLSELEEGTKPVKLIEAYEILQNSVNYVRIAYQERAIDLVIQTFSERIFLQANELLQDVFDNILTNAVKYNDNSLIEILINVSREIKGDQKYLKFEFIDNGIGIKNEKKELIFKKGHRESKGEKGLGLGLSLVNKIITSLNGEIWVENKVEDDYTQGSKFVILIPEAPS